MKTINLKITMSAKKVTINVNKTLERSFVRNKYGCIGEQPGDWFEDAEKGLIREAVAEMLDKISPIGLMLMCEDGSL